MFLPIPALLPAYPSGVLHAQASVGGYLLAAQGVGGFTAAFTKASVGFGTRKGKVGLISLIEGCAAILIVAQSHWLMLSIGMMVFLGLAQTSFIVSNQTLVQSMIPDNLRGRVTSIYMLEFGLGPVAIFLIGLLMELYTVSGALTIVAAVGLGLSIYFFSSFQRVRRLE